MMIPSVHSNGTSKTELIQQFMDASEALDLAYRTLKKAAPNGRDYYVQGDTALGYAIHDHDARLSKIDEVQREVNAIIMAIDEQC